MIFYLQACRRRKLCTYILSMPEVESNDILFTARHVGGGHYVHTYILSMSEVESNDILFTGMLAKVETIYIYTKHA